MKNPEKETKSVISPLPTMEGVRDLIVGAPTTQEDISQESEPKTNDNSDRTVTVRQPNVRRTYGDGVGNTITPSISGSKEDAIRRLASQVSTLFTHRDAYESDVRHIEVFDQLLSANKRFNKSKYIRDAVEEKMKKDGLL